MEFDLLIKKLMKKVLTCKWVLRKNSELNMEECVYIDRWVDKHYKDDFKDSDEAFISLINDYTLDKLIEAEMMEF